MLLLSIKIIRRKYLKDLNIPDVEFVDEKKSIKLIAIEA
jgi:hypothetical protein